MAGSLAVPRSSPIPYRCSQKMPLIRSSTRVARPAVPPRRRPRAPPPSALARPPCGLRLLRRPLAGQLDDDEAAVGSSGCARPGPPRRGGRASPRPSRRSPRPPRRARRPGSGRARAARPAARTGRGRPRRRGGCRGRAGCAGCGRRGGRRGRGLRARPRARALGTLDPPRAALVDRRQAPIGSTNSSASSTAARDGPGASSFGPSARSSTSTGISEAAQIPSAHQ